MGVLGNKITLRINKYKPLTQFIGNNFTATCFDPQAKT
jgi:hypothetical protein